ncbi:hypothetical protein CYMTET_8104 [Cymbomonas tetramitiformis]|uniref:Uncharacterized protein n=1 Tax=Cymbomonas tetramitiformis TaxID=36881 RepID=A0AAE0LGT7_9CHLO|nr:hypothetical protein CYMTET_8104 [Cymbomonas tetramitiformis]
MNSRRLVARRSVKDISGNATVTFAAEVAAPSSAEEAAVSLARMYEALNESEACTAALCVEAGGVPRHRHRGVGHGKGALRLSLAVPPRESIKCGNAVCEVGEACADRETGLDCEARGRCPDDYTALLWLCPVPDASTGVGNAS